jgi:hypothetical protein
MRWSTFAATLAPAEAARLVNLITAGRGYLYLAVRLTPQGAETRQVARRVAQARRCFVAVADALPPAGAPGRERDPAPPAAGEAALAVARELALAQDQARQLAAVIQTDGELNQLQLHVAATVVCLQHLQVRR